MAAFSDSQLKSASPDPSPVGGFRAGLLLLCMATGIATIIAVVIAYEPALQGEFLFDDQGSITSNPSIRDLWRMDQILAPPPRGGTTVDGRPVLNLTFALNYAIGAESTFSYHLLNIVIHLVNTLLIICLMTCALSWIQPDLSREYRWLIGWIAGLLWAIHPLPVAAVAYISQRAESLSAMFLLLAMVLFSISILRSQLIQILQVAPILFLGSLTKETMVGAPLILMLYDRAFYATSWQELRKRRSLVHLANWLVVGIGIAIGQVLGGRGSSAGFDGKLSSLDYFGLQSINVPNYFWKTIWPTGLAVDYGIQQPYDPLVSTGLSIAALIVFLASCFWYWQNPKSGFLPLAILVWMAPSSSFIPIQTQTGGEHRFYLPAAGVICSIILLLIEWATRQSKSTDHKISSTRWLIIIGIVSILLMIPITRQYSSQFATSGQLLASLAENRPSNWRAVTTRSRQLAAAGQCPEAIALCERAEHLSGNRYEAALAKGACFELCQKGSEAVAQYRQAVQLRPLEMAGYYGLGRSLKILEDRVGAVSQLTRALEIQPLAIVFCERGDIFLEAGRMAEAKADFLSAVSLDPFCHRALSNLAGLTLEAGDMQTARALFERAIACDPKDVQSHYWLAAILATNGERARALYHAKVAASLSSNPLCHELLQRLTNEEVRPQAD
ncbi:Tetratricopeptide repeat protein [Planctopirus ephydatiae]|uniref:Tetratricopeptide repeat protein n=1 Tax=Planctopirus ephydatiae TaxID=2528019 RepID=A0A518GT04_9PLAN|nr:tetratricopeptide repeat protein [Planctopirus ephydatiae]QDV31721.1 Tetratricopeptide repeat protein [Planctopirus ephydatiae]